MLPRWHILSGAIFSALIWFFSPYINPLYIIAIFLSSFLIDIDHYINASVKNNHPSLLKSFAYYRKLDDRLEMEKRRGIRKKGDFHLFHTLEFHALIGFVGYFFPLFFYIFIGMVFHSLLDVADLVYTDRIYIREFFFFNWLAEKIR